MKIRAIHTLLPVLLPILVGCADSYDPAGGMQPSLTARSLTASKSTFESYSPDAFSETFSIESSDVPWRFSDTPAWIAVSPMTGETSQDVNMDVEANPSADDVRTGIFYLTSTDPEWEYSAPISVSQWHAQAVLTVDRKELTFSGASSTQTVQVTANCRWSVTSSDSWLTLTPDTKTGMLAVNAAENASETYRYGTIKVGYGTRDYITISVTQSPASVTASEHNLRFNNAASRYDLEITAEADWTAIASDSWIQVSPDHGSIGTSAVAVEVAPNTAHEARYGSVTFRIGERESLSVSIMQRGMYLETVESLEFVADPQTYTINLESNVDWELISAPEWIWLSQTKGTGDARLNISAAINTSLSARSGVVVIGCPGLNIQTTISVFQLGRYMSVAGRAFQFGSIGGTHTVELETNESWAVTAEDSPSWLHLSKTSGSGTAEFTISADDNPSIASRSAIVTVTPEYSPAVSILVTQNPRYLRVYGDNLLLFAKGGTTDPFTIEADGPYTVSSSAAWFAVTRLTGDTYTVTASQNTTNEMRRGEIIISMSDLTDGTLEVRLSVVQAGEGGSFIINGYPEDADWDSSSTSNSAISIRGYSSDSDWSRAFSGLMSVKISGFDSDRNWDKVKAKSDK